MQEFTYITAFTVGLMGGVHCVGMCGGIVGALSFAIHQQKDQQKNGSLSILIAYNFGRLLSYAIAGGLMGTVGWLVTHWVDIKNVQVLLQLLAGFFMLLMGLYISGIWMGLTRIEKIGSYLWRYLQPVAQKLLPVKGPVSAIALGGLWGWLPCGLVYSVLVWSVASGDFMQGALLMLSFGLGTLPNLLAMGMFANQLKMFIQKKSVRYFSGGVVILFAFWNIFLALRPALSQ